VSPAPRPLRRVTFYTKAGCHLCEQAEELLEDLDEYDVQLTKIDITEDLAIFERYKYEIPVIVVEGGGTVGGRISAEALRRALAGRQP
jgi:glutaredoxin